MALVDGRAMQDLKLSTTHVLMDTADIDAGSCNWMRCYHMAGVTA